MLSDIPILDIYDFKPILSIKNIEPIINIWGK